MDRFPGPKPYTPDNEPSFFGRADDKSQLNNLISRNQLTVLFGRSGFGKSSLIQAGVIPYFQSISANYGVVQLRIPFEVTAPDGVESMADQINKQLDPKQEILIPREKKKNDQDIWYAFKNFQWQSKKKGYQGLIVILDQIEELFQLPTEEREAIIQQIAALLYNIVPPEFKNQIREDLSSKTNVIPEHVLTFTENEIETHFLFGIRSDKLYLLDELGTIIPTIFKSRHSLRQIKSDQITSILQQAALADGNFECPKFKFSARLLDAINKYLIDPKPGSTKSKNEYLDLIELQIIGQFLERKIIAKRKEGAFNEYDEIDLDFLPGTVENILRIYYTRDVLDKKTQAGTNAFSTVQQLVLRYLIEKELINEKDEQRKTKRVNISSLPMMGIDTAMFAQIIQTGIVRSESDFIELSHDSLVQGVLHVSRNELPDLYSEMEKYLKSSYTKSTIKRSVFKKIIQNRLVNEKGKSVPIRIAPDLISPERSALDQLTTWKIMEKQETVDKVEFELYDAFEPVVNSLVHKRNTVVIKRLNLRLFLTLFLSLLFLYLLTSAITNANRENARRVAGEVNIIEVEEPSALINLLILEETYNKLTATEKHKNKNVVRERLLNQFNWLASYFSTPITIPNYNVVYRLGSPDQSALLVAFEQNQSSSTNYYDKRSALRFYSQTMDSTLYGIGTYSFIGPKHDLVVIKGDSLVLFRGDLKTALILNHEDFAGSMIRSAAYLNQNEIILQLMKQQLEFGQFYSQELFYTISIADRKHKSAFTGSWSKDAFLLKNNPHRLIQISYRDSALSLYDISTKKSIATALDKHKGIKLITWPQQSDQPFAGNLVLKDTKNDSLICFNPETLAVKDLPLPKSYRAAYDNDMAIIIFPSGDSLDLNVYDRNQKLVLISKTNFGKSHLSDLNVRVYTDPDGKSPPKAFCFADDRTNIQTIGPVRTSVAFLSTQASIKPLDFNIADASFSTTGDSIIVASQDINKVQQYNVILLNSGLNTLFKGLNYASPTVIKSNFVSFARKNMLNVVPRHGSPLNNTDIDQVLTFIHKERETLNDSLKLKLAETRRSHNFESINIKSLLYPW